jgi:type III secretion protein J
MRTFRPLILTIIGFLLASCGGKVELLKDIAEAEANEAIAVLLDAGIASTKIPGKEGVVSLEVEQAKVARAIDILNAEGLPRERFAKMGDVFRKEGLISSPLEERARYIWALSQELSATLAQIDGVIKARVHVVLPEKSTGGDPALPSSAAVFLKHKQGIMLDESVPQIKRLVSNSIPGLSADKVTVVMLPSAGKASLNAEFRAGNVLPMAARVSSDSVSPATESPSEGDAWIYIVATAAALLGVLAGMAFMIWKKWGIPKAGLPRAVQEKS